MDHPRNRRSGRRSALVPKRSWLRSPRALRATRAGWCFIAIIFGVGLAALNTGNNLLYLVLALMLSFLVLSGLLSEASLRGIRVERSLPREIFAASPNRVILRVHNAARRNASFAITIEDRLRTASGLQATGRTFAMRVGAQSTAKYSYRFEPERRGEILFDGFEVSTRFPFGLFVKSCLLEAIESAIVYPAITRVPQMSRTTRGGSDREDLSGESKDGDEITGLREFEPGDSVGRVHWRSSVRAGKLRVGEIEGFEKAEFEVWLRLPPNTSEEGVEQRVARAASEVVGHLETGSLVGLRSETACFEAATGFSHRSEMLRFLARVTLDAHDSSGAQEISP